MNQPVSLPSILSFITKRFESEFAKYAMKPKQRNPDAKVVSLFVARDFLDDEVEVLIEIESYEPPQQGGTWDETLPAHVELGDSFLLSGESFELTPLERETAAERALEQIEAAAKEAEEDRQISEAQ